MEKRLLAMLLCVAMVASLLTVGAAADVCEENVESTDVVEHTVEIDTYSESNTTNASSSSSADRLISFTVTDVNGDDISLLDGGVSIRLGEQYTFKVQFSDPDSIKSVYVTSTIGDEVKMLEAVRSGDIFVTSGYFDNEPDYTPGSIGVKYTEVVEPAVISTEIDWTPMLEALGGDADVNIISANESSVKAQIDLSEFISSEAKAVLDVTVDLYDEANGTDIDDVLGLYENFGQLVSYDLGNGNTAYTDDTIDSSYVAFVKAEIGGVEKLVKLVFDTDDSVYLWDVASQLGNIGTILGMAQNYYSITESTDQLREEIYSRDDLSEEDKAALNEQVDIYENDRLLFNVSVTALPLLAASIAPTAGLSIAFCGLVGILNASQSLLWNARIGEILEETEDISFIPNSHDTVLTREYMREHDDTLTSGSYCLGDDSIWGIIIPSGADVSLCLHDFSCSIINYGTLSIYDCGGLDGDESTVGQASMENHGGNITFNNGRGWIENYGSGRIRVFGGNISSIDEEYLEEPSGEELDVIIYNGLVEHIDCINGNVYIYGGIVGWINNQHGYTGVGGGIVGYRDSNNRYTITTNDGKIDINSGTIAGLYNSEDHTYYGAITGDLGSSLTVYNTSDTKVYGDILMDGPITIFGGTFNGDITCRYGDSQISDGAFYGQINLHSYDSQSHNKLIIEGGTFYSSSAELANVSVNCGELVIDGGTFNATGSYNLYAHAGNMKSEINIIINAGQFESYGDFGLFFDRTDTYNGADHSTILSVIPHVIINNGEFSASNSVIYNTGNLTINAGTFTQTGQKNSEYVCLNNADSYGLGDSVGVTTINGGTFSGYNRCIENSGNMAITGGSFSQVEEEEYYSRLIDNMGEMTIEGGLFTSNAETIRNGGTLTDEDGALTINAGIFNKNGEVEEYLSCIYNEEESIMTVNGGTFNMQKGSYCIDSDGTATINGGTFNVTSNLSCVNSNGNLTVNYAVFNMSGGFTGITTENDNIVISGLRFKGPTIPWGVRAQAVTLSVDDNFFLEIDSDSYAFYKRGDSTAPDIIVNIELANGYTGGLRYYDSKDSEGVTLSASEFDQIDFSSDYLRLEAENVTPGGPDDNPGTDCDHSYVTTVIEPTCENRGYTVYTCTKCGHTYTGNYVDATGHSYGEWIVTREPTDSTAGQRERICSVCKEKEIEIIPATGTDTPIIVGPGWTPSFSVNTPVKTENGNVSVSETRAEENDTVVITVNPDYGYELDKLIVTDANGNGIDVVALGNGKFEFTMPATAVSVEATFAEAMVNTFVDVSVADWFVDAVKYVVRHSIMEGISDNEFAPLSTMSRAMVWTILARIDGETVTGAGWIDEALSWAMADGISDGTDPNGLVTREQFATMLYRYAGEPEVSGNLSAYTDASSISDWAQDAMTWAVSNGIITGVTATTLEPQGTATRAQAAAMLMRFVEM